MYVRWRQISGSAKSAKNNSYSLKNNSQSLKNNSQSYKNLKPNYTKRLESWNNLMHHSLLIYSKTWKVTQSNRKKKRKQEMLAKILEIADPKP
jgi:hypothetical protein